MVKKALRTGLAAIILTGASIGCATEAPKTIDPIQKAQKSVAHYELVIAKIERNIGNSKTPEERKEWESQKRLRTITLKGAKRRYEAALLQKETEEKLRLYEEQPQSVKPLEQIITEFRTNLDGINQERKKELDQYKKEFDESINKYDKETIRLYKQRLDELDKERKAIEDYQKRIEATKKALEEKYQEKSKQKKADEKYQEPKEKAPEKKPAENYQEPKKSNLEEF